MLFRMIKGQYADRSRLTFVNTLRLRLRHIYYIIHRCASLKVEMAEGFVETCWNEVEGDEELEEEQSKVDADEENQVFVDIKYCSQNRSYTEYFQFCQCKSMCLRANKCPCKSKGRFCTARCRCKSKS